MTYGDNHICDEDSTLLTNMKVAKAPFVKQAIKESDARIVIHEQAFNCQGKIMEGYIALHIEQPRQDLTAFWKIFDKLDKIGT